MKKVIASLFVASACLDGILPTVAQAEAEDVNGASEANITVNGTIGVDNTNPEANINEGSDAWINVTLDTATVFYNVAGQTTIESPTYNIENKSGRPVNVSVTAFSHTNSEDIAGITKLNLVSTRSDGTDSTETPLFSGAGTPIGTLETPESILPLANNDRDMGDGTKIANANKATFGYTGEVSETATASKPSFTLTLQFDVPTTWTPTPTP